MLGSWIGFVCMQTDVRWNGVEWCGWWENGCLSTKENVINPLETIHK